MNLVDFILQNKAEKPFFCFRREALIKAADFFNHNFCGKSLYAVKTNPDPLVLKQLWQSEIRSFDVASIEEIADLKELFPEAELFFMHPAKPRYAIKKAYFDYGIRHFSLDCEAELNKIIQETGGASDLVLHLRISVPNFKSKFNGAKKFGADLVKAPELLRKTAHFSHKTGLSFHVGSQCMDPEAYKKGISLAADVLKSSKVELSYFNVGGGFPSIYSELEPPPLKQYFSSIHEHFKTIPDHENIQLLAEPGRALTAESMSLVVRVDLRKGRMLYINEGTYGSLFDASIPNFKFPVRLLSPKKDPSQEFLPFSFYGPTCDSLDFMPGPFLLPENTEEGDLIEIGQMGSYAKALRSNFNGFSIQNEIIEVSDPPLLSMYN